MPLRPRLGSQAGPPPQLKAAGPLRGAALGLLPSGSVPVLRTSFVGSLPRCAHKLVSLAQRVAWCGWRTCRARCYCGHAALQSCWPRSPTPHRAASPEDVAGLRRGLMLYRGVVACNEDPTQTRDPIAGPDGRSRREVPTGGPDGRSRREVPTSGRDVVGPFSTVRNNLSIITGIQVGKAP